MSHPADDLIAAWLADDLDADGVRALEAHLRDDPAARERFARFCQSETVLAQALASAPVRPGTTGLRRAVRGGSRRMRVRRPVGKFGWLLPFSVAAALLAVVVTVGVMRSTPPPPVVVQHGPLEVVALGTGTGEVVVSAGRPLQVGMQAPRGAQVEVRASGVAFRWRDGTRLEAGAATMLQVIDGETAIRVDSGRLVAEVTRRTDQPFRIATPHASATVMGTRFSVDVVAGTSVLQVSEGRVRFGAGEAVREVLAGESVSADAAGLRIEGDARVLGFTPTARDITRVLGPRMIQRGTLRLVDLTAGINLRIDCPSEVRSVRTGLHAGTQRLEQVRDYFVFGDAKNRATTAWEPTVGTYRIDAQPYADVDGREPLGPPVVFELTIAP